MENKDFVHLHVHSHFSLLDALPTTKELLNKAKELGFDTLALTDHASISGLWKFYKYAKKIGIKPLLGCEFYVVEDEKIKGLKKIDKTKKQGFKITKQRSYHLVLLAKNYEGFKVLCELISSAHDGYYYVPRISWNLLKQVETENLIAMTACKQGFVPEHILTKNKIAIDNNIQLMKDLFGNDFYFELQHHDFDAQFVVNSGLVKLSKIHNIPLVLTNDVHYLQPSDNWVRDVAHCIKHNARYNNTERTKFDMAGLEMKSADELIDCISNNNPSISKNIIINAAKNTREVADKININFVLPDVFDTVPLISIPKRFKSRNDYFWYLCENGLKKRGKNKIPDYKKRLKEEFDTIVKLEFVEYFLLVWDLINWTRNQNILIGTARGSVASSLVAYCLEISSVDPIKHKLLFWRFISPNRKDLPDIDIDFQEDRRNEVKKYLRKKYGENSVANMITHSILKGKAVLRDVCRVFEIPSKEVNRISKYILQRSSAEMRDSFTIEDSLKTFKEIQDFAKRFPKVIEAAMRLEGRVRHHGVHAAAVVVSNLNLRKYCGLLIGRDDEKKIAFDKHDSKEENLNLLKIDILGLTNLAIMNKALELIKQNHNEEIDIYDLPLDDKKVIDEFDKGNTDGVFQFETFGFKKLLRNIKIDNFEKIIHANALSRPGALHSNATKKYISNQKASLAGKNIKYLHKIMKPYLVETYGQVIFQEQLMEILYDIGKFNWTEVAQIRVTMSKSLGSEFFLDKEEKFIKNAVKAGIKSDSTAKNIYRGFMHYGSWAFNRAHSVAYSLMSYANMWLRTHYPHEFLTAALSYDRKNEQNLIQEVLRQNIQVLPPDINKSKKEYSIEKGNIRQGFNQIKGLGNKTTMLLVQKQPFKDWNDFLDKVERRTINKKRIEHLMEAGCFTCWFPNVIKTLANLDKLLKKNIDIISQLTKENYKILETNIIKRPINYAKWRIVEDKFLQNLDKFYRPFYVDGYEELKDTEKPLVILSGVISYISPKKYKETVEALRGNLTGVRDMELMYCNINITNDKNETILIQLSPKVFNKYRVWVLEEGLGKPIVAVGTILKSTMKLYTSQIFSLEKDITDCILYRYPLKDYESLFNKYELKSLSFRNHLMEGESFATAVVLEHFKFWTTKKGTDMTFLKVSDGQEVLRNIILWNDATTKFRDELEIGVPYAMFFTKRKDGGLCIDLRRGGKIKKLEELKDV